MIYNDAYSVFAGGRHPGCWAARCARAGPRSPTSTTTSCGSGLAGGTLAYKDQELTLLRPGRAEQVWMNLDYSPVVDDAGQAERRDRHRRRDDRPRARRTAACRPNANSSPGCSTRRRRSWRCSAGRSTGSTSPIPDTASWSVIDRRSARRCARRCPRQRRKGYLDLLDQVFESGEAFSARRRRSTRLRPMPAPR